MLVVSWEELYQQKKFCVDKVVMRFANADGVYDLDVYSAKNAVVLPSGAVVIKNKSMLYLVRESFVRPTTPEKVIEEFVVARGDCIARSSAVSLCDARSHAVYHWLLEQIPRFLAMRKMGFAGDYIVRDGVKYAFESLLGLGVSPDRVFTSSCASYCENLFFPLRPTFARDVEHAALISDIRKEILPVAARRKAVVGVYVARRSSPNRNIVNKDELYEVLLKYGILIQHLEDLPFFDQVGLIASSRMIIGPLGSGMTHCVFLAPASTMVELFPPTYVCNYHYHAVKYLKLKYHMLLPEVLPRVGYRHGLDIEVSVHNLEVVLGNLSWEGCA